MDATSAGVIIGTIGAAIGGVIGVLSTKGVDAWLKIRADQRTDAKEEDEREDKEEVKTTAVLQQLVSRQDGEISSLRSELRDMQSNYRAELKQVHDQRNECEKKHMALETELKIRMEMMNARMDRTDSAVKSVEQEVSQTRPAQES